MKILDTAKLIVFMSVSMMLFCAGPGNVFKEKGLTTGEPGMNIYQSGEAGTTQPLERPYSTAPPLIPHDIQDMTISTSDNDCVTCHLDGMEVEEGHVATKIPPSHFVNEFTGEHTDDQVAGIRYNCLQCHVPQATAEMVTIP